MRKFLFVVYLFLLAERDEADKIFPKLGDIVRFHGHYTLYLGNKEFLIQTTTGCHKFTVQKDIEGLIDNYQDKPDSPPDINGIKKRVEECTSRIGVVDKSFGTCCGKYDKMTNNCEETATYIRYGKEGRISCLVYAFFKMEQFPKKCENWKKLDAVTFQDTAMDVFRSLTKN